MSILPTGREVLPTAKSVTGIDGMSDAGARQLKAMIMDYWEKREFKPDIKIVKLPRDVRDGRRETVSLVRGNLLGGLPREAFMGAIAAAPTADREKQAATLEAA